MSVGTVPDDLDGLLDALTRSTGQSQAEFVREAIEAGLEDVRDVAIARERLADPDRRVPLAEVKRQLGLAD